MARMRAANISLSILKIDCEGCEFEFFTPHILSRLRFHNVQILVEVHWEKPTDPMSQGGGHGMARLWSRLTSAGFSTFHKEPNIQYTDGSCVEYALVYRPLNRTVLDHGHHRGGGRIAKAIFDKYPYALLSAKSTPMQTPKDERTHRRLRQVA